MLSRVLSSSRQGLKLNRRTFISHHQFEDSRRLLQNPAGVRLGWSNEVISMFLPFTSMLIKEKGRSFENIAISYCQAQEPVKSEGDKIGKRRMDDSWLEIILPFSDHSSLRDAMMTSDAGAVRYGKLFEILDGLAGDIAYRHCGGRTEKLAIVTASVDGMKASRRIDINHDVRLQGYLTYVGTSSMEIAIDMVSVTHEGTTNVGNIKFIMVARNELGKAHPVPGLLWANDEAKEKFEEGRERAQSRRERARQSLSLTPPLGEEISLIHSLYLESLQLKKEKDMFMQTQWSQLTANVSNAASDTTSTATPDLSNERTKKSVAAAAATLDHPHTFRTKFKWMKSTNFKNVQIMFPQDRNVHGKIFGGYIMRKAFELAHISAVCYTAEAHPLFEYVDDIQFVMPVNIGSIMEFSSTVTYTSGPYLVVQVEAFDVTAYTGVKTKTNIFKYVFRATSTTHSLPQVMPREYEEIVLYLEGKRSMDQLMAEDKE